MTELVIGSAGAALSRTEFDKVRSGGDASLGAPGLLQGCAPLAVGGDPEVVPMTEFLSLKVFRPGRPTAPVVAPTKLLQLLDRAPERSARLGRAAVAAREVATALKAADGGQPAAPSAPTIGPVGRRTPATIATTRSRSTAAPLARAPRAGLPSLASPVGVAPEVLRIKGAGRRAGRPSLVLRDAGLRERLVPELDVIARLDPGADGVGLLRPDRTRRPAHATVDTELVRHLWDGARELAEIDVHTSPATQPHWGVRIDYEQRWIRQGYKRGRLLRSVPLAPSESIEILVKSWSKQSTKSTTVDVTESNDSTEVTGDERWSLATAKEMARTTSASIEPTAGIKAGVTLPVGELPVKLDGNLGATGNFSNQLQNNMKKTVERTQQLTTKTASSLKVSRTQTVELASESGTETTITERLSNPNTCRTLTYDFFEVVEDYSVVTVPVAVEPVVFLPLPAPAWHLGEVLRHSCELADLLPCADLQAGLAGAKLMAVAAKRGVSVEVLRTELAQLEQQSEEDAARSVLTAPLTRLADLVAAFGSAQLLDLERLLEHLPDPPDLGETFNDVGDLFDAFGKKVDEAADKGGDAFDAFGKALDAGLKGDLDTAVDQAGKGAAGVVDAGGTLVEGAVDLGMGLAGTLVDAGGDLLEGVGQLISFSTAASTAPQLGMGSAIWWQVAQLVSPDLVQALEVLSERVQLIRELPAGASREQAEIDAIENFTAAAGDVNLEFMKIDIALALLAAALVAGAGWATHAIPGAGLIGPAVVAGVITLAKLIDVAGLGDVFPDDAGMRALVKQVVARGTAVADQQAMGPDVGAAALLERRERLEKELAALAEAEVEFERLRGHLVSLVDRYGPVVWSKLSSSDISRLAGDSGLPPGLVEPSFQAFVGGRAAVRVVQPALALGLGFDWLTTEKSLDVTTVQPVGDLLTVPTPGVVVESRLGSCDACEDYVDQHRSAELRVKEAEARSAEEKALQAKLETQRFKARLAQQPPELDDPEPAADAASIRIVLDKPPTP